MAQPKNCPFGVNTTTELKNKTNKSDSNSNIVISRDMFRLPSVPILSDIFVVFEINCSIKPNSWIVPLLHSVSDMRKIFLNAVPTCSSSSPPPPPPPPPPSSPTGATFHHELFSLLMLPSLAPDPRTFPSNF